MNEQHRYAIFRSCEKDARGQAAGGDGLCGDAGQCVNSHTGTSLLVSNFLSILPIAVKGRASRMTMDRGSLYLARRSRRKALQFIFGVTVFYHNKGPADFAPGIMWHTDHGCFIDERVSQ